MGPGHAKDRALIFYRTCRSYALPVFRCASLRSFPCGLSQVRGSKTFLGYARPWQSSSRRTGALSGRFARAIRRDQPIRAPESAAIHDRCAGVGSGRRASAQVRNALHAQPLGDVPQNGSDWSRRTGPEDVPAATFPAAPARTRRCCPDDRGSRRRRAITTLSPRDTTGPCNPRVAGNCRARTLRSSLPAPNRAAAGLRSGRAGATPPDLPPAPSQERCQRATRSGRRFAPAPGHARPAS